MIYFLYILFGLAPSVIWLLFFLRKDSHPESNRMILKIFSYGMLVALPAALVEMGIFEFFNKLIPFISKWLGANFSSNNNNDVITILNVFIGVALIEEIIKYLVVKEKVLNHPEFDEPLDVMLYMIIAALGFAAVENLLILFPLVPHFLIGQALAIISFRFIGATFLHALCSGLIGYFLALSFLKSRRRTELILTGLGTAVILHGFYNFSIMLMKKEELRIIIPVILLSGLAIFISFGLKKLKKMGSYCKIK